MDMQLDHVLDETRVVPGMLVDNAGVARPSSSRLEDLTLRDWTETLRLNCESIVDRRNAWRPVAVALRVREAERDRARQVTRDRGRRIWDLRRCNLPGTVSGLRMDRVIASGQTLSVDSHAESLASRCKSQV